MNYFAHGRRFVAEPYFLAGTAAPDWLSVVDRKVRLRQRLVAPHALHPDARFAAFARGVSQHLADDHWFHVTRAFAELSLDFCVRLRDLLQPDEGLRPHFVGHILVEILLDATLIANEPAELDAYYAALESLCPATIQDAVNLMGTGATDRLAQLLPAFCRERFLWDYLEDGKLLYRLNQVMRRVNLAPLPQTVLELLPEARRLVQSRQVELLTPTEADTSQANTESAAATALERHQ